MDKKTLPQLLDLPFACDSEHDEVIYWYTGRGASTTHSVHLHKEIQLIEFDMWVPVRFYTPGGVGIPGKTLSERDMELASIKAYDDLNKGQRERDGEVAIKVRLQGYPNGVKVIMGKAVYHYEQSVWCDDDGRVW